MRFFSSCWCPTLGPGSPSLPGHHGNDRNSETGGKHSVPTQVSVLIQFVSLLAWPHDAADTLVHAFVTSRFDHCYSPCGPITFLIEFSALQPVSLGMSLNWPLSRLTCGTHDTALASCLATNQLQNSWTGLPLPHCHCSDQPAIAMMLLCLGCGGP